MRWTKLLLVWTVLFGANAVSAGESTEEVMVQPRQVVVQVKGVVCSFCAYGTEKNLSKLKFLDKAQFGDGVLMDIHANRITLALDPNKPLDLKGIHQAIKKGGYDPLTVYLRLSGRVTKQGDRYVLSATDSGQAFELSGQDLERLAGGQVVNIQARLDASLIPALPEGQPIRVVVDKLDVGS
jgi:hypothetical protein